MADGFAERIRGGAVGGRANVDAVDHMAIVAGGETG
jgi:hypothetical protein